MDLRKIAISLFLGSMGWGAPNVRYVTNAYSGRPDAIIPVSTATVLSGSNITVTDNGNNSVTISGTGGSPGNPSGSYQYNNSGSFAGDGNSYVTTSSFSYTGSGGVLISSSTSIFPTGLGHNQGILGLGTQAYGGSGAGGYLQVIANGGSSYGGNGPSLASFISNSSFGGFTVGAPNGSNTFIEFTEGGTTKAAIGWNSGNVPYNYELTTHGSFDIDEAGNISPPLLEILSNGNVGMGTVAPSQRLHISSGTLLIDGNVSPAIEVAGSGAPPNSQALCFSSGQLGHCTTVVSSSGGCTCSVP